LTPFSLSLPSEKKKYPRQRINAPAGIDKGEDAAGYPLDRDDFGLEQSEIMTATRFSAGL
jgi:hypothetical protein